MYDYGPHKPIFHKELVSHEPPLAEEAVPTSEITIAQLLKTRGYHTVFFGKWHLGETDATRPDHRGFDETLGFLAGASMYLRANDPAVENSVQDFDPIDKFLWANLPFAVTRNGSHRFYPSEYMTDYLGDEAVKAINANRNRPFFIYLAFNAPHVPLQALKSDFDALPQIKDHRLRVYGAMIRALDRNVGHVMSALKANGLDQNTLVIFTSDNGGANYIGLPYINRPYRGWKATFFEGGIHVPFFMRWPAKIRGGHEIQSADRAYRHLRDRGRGGRCAVAHRSRDGRRQRDSVCHRGEHRKSAHHALLALGIVQDAARRRVEAAGVGDSGQDVAVRFENRPDRAQQPRVERARQAQGDGADARRDRSPAGQAVVAVAARRADRHRSSAVVPAASRRRVHLLVQLILCEVRFENIENS